MNFKIAKVILVKNVTYAVSNKTSPFTNSTTNAVFWFQITKSDNIVGYCGTDQIVLVKYSDEKKRNKVYKILAATEEEIGTGYSFCQSSMVSALNAVISKWSFSRCKCGCILFRCSFTCEMTTFSGASSLNRMCQLVVLQIPPRLCYSTKDLQP